MESLEGDDTRRFLEIANDRVHVNKFPIRHLLLVTLIHLRCNTKQELLAAILKINQSNICRYIQFTKRGMIKILPTADTMYEFTSSGILCINHINCSDQLCVNLDTGELIRYNCGCAIADQVSRPYAHD